MKKQIKITGKRIFAVLLVMLMIVGIFPANSLGGLFDWSVTASAQIITSSKEYFSLSTSDYFRNGSSVVNATTNAYSLRIFIDGVHKKTCSPATSCSLPTASGGTYAGYKVQSAPKTLETASDGTLFYRLNLTTVGDVRAVPSVTPPTALTLVYNGQSQVLTSGGSTSGGTFQQRHQNGTWGTARPTGIEVGDYPLEWRVVGNDNYQGVSAKTITAHITAAPISPEIQQPDITYPATPNPTISGNPENGTETTYYSTSENGSYTITVPTEPGVYWTYADVAATKNYQAGTTPKISFKINKAPINPQLIIPETIPYGTPVTATISGNTDNGQETYYYSQSSNSGFTSNVPTDPGKYYAYATVGETNHYLSGTTPVVSFTILQKNKIDPEVTAPTPINKPYNGSEQALLSSPGTTTGGTLQYSLSSDTSNDSNWSTSYPNGMNHGNYPVYYRVKGNDDYNDWGPQSVTAVITKAPISPTISISDVTLPAQPAPSVSGNPGNGTVTYHYCTSENGEYTDEVPSTPGTYWVYATVGETTNYLAGETPKKSFKINAAGSEKIDPVVTAPVGITKPYNEQDQILLSTPATTTGGTLQYRLDGTNWSPEIPKAKNINDYTVYYRVVGNDQYNDWGPQSVPAKITKITPTVTPPDGINKPYTENEQPLLDTPATTTGGTIEYSTDNENWSPEIPKAKDVGDYTVYYRVVGNDIYESVDPKSVPAKITDGDTPPVGDDDDDNETTVTGTITVHDIDKKDTPTVTAYKIVKGTYRNGKLTGYVLCNALGDTFTIANLKKPTEDEICAIATAIREGSIHPVSIPMVRGTESSDRVSYSAQAKPGTYIVLVTGSTEGYIYNPAIVSVNVNDANAVDSSVEGGSVSMLSYFDYPNEAYIKSSKAVMDKNIIVDGAKTKGASAGYGETVSFRIDNMTIPSYSHDFTDLTYKITDSLEANAFTGINNMTVKVDGTAIAPGSATYTVSAKDKNGSNAAVSIDNNIINIPTGVWFEISFASSFLFDNDSKSVVIDYSSVISDTSGYNYSENQNTVALVYSLTPDSTNTVKATTYHYSFGISSTIDAEGEAENPAVKHVIVYEINKVSKKCTEYDIVEDGNGNQIKKNKMALPGAEFMLYDSFDRTNALRVGVSNEFGGVPFTGLKTGTYYITETKAPNGYTINDTIYRVEIDANFSDVGVMTSYSINIYVADSTGGRGQLVSSATYTNTPTVNDDGSVTNEIIYLNNEENQLTIINTELAKLPSTGGIGTIMLTIISSAGMAAFLAMFLVNKKKSIKNYFDE